MLKRSARLVAEETLQEIASGEIVVLRMLMMPGKCTAVDRYFRRVCHVVLQEGLCSCLPCRDAALSAQKAWVAGSSLKVVARHRIICCTVKPKLCSCFRKTNMELPLLQEYQ